jgi:hypothetical protein
MIEVPGYLADQLDKEAEEAKQKEEVSRETTEKEGVDKMYVDPKDRVLDPSKADDSLLDRMPNPTGWRMLILPYRGKAQTEGGIYIPDQVLDPLKTRPFGLQRYREVSRGPLVPGKRLGDFCSICWFQVSHRWWRSSHT